MSDDLKDVEQRFNALVASLKPQSRKALMRKIGNEISKSQRKRITAEKNPDGTAFAPRKKPKKIKTAKGRIRARKMFSKLKSARFMKKQVSANGVEIGYSGRVGKLAQIHQQGLTEKHGKKTYHNPQRELLGLTKEDVGLIEREIVEVLARG